MTNVLVSVCACQLNQVVSACAAQTGDVHAVHGIAAVRFADLTFFTSRQLGVILMTVSTKNCLLRHLADPARGPTQRSVMMAEKLDFMSLRQMVMQ